MAAKCPRDHGKKVSFSAVWSGRLIRALEVWPFPELSADVVASHRPVKKAAPAMKSMTFRAVCTMAEIAPGTELYGWLVIGLLRMRSVALGFPALLPE